MHALPPFPCPSNTHYVADDAMRLLHLHAPPPLLAVPHRYDVYDAVAYGPTNFLLLKRMEQQQQEAAAAAAATAVPQPGEAGRWALPEDASGLQGVAALFGRMQDVYELLVSLQACLKKPRGITAFGECSALRAFKAGCVATLPTCRCL